MEATCDCNRTKVYCLNDGTTSYLSNFYLFRGRDAARPVTVPASAYPVIRLLDNELYHNRNHICFVDNFFNGLYLCMDLLGKGIHTCGTFRTNRVKVSTPVFYTKTGAGRGERGEMKQSKIGENMYITSWFDKKPVNMLSTFPTYSNTCIRNDRNKKSGVYTKLKLPRPTIIAAYNKGMGGTDLFDQFLSYYRTSVKTKRWPHTVIFHFLLCSVVNSWILYKDIYHPDKHGNNGNLYSYITNLVGSMCDMSDGTNADVDECEIGDLCGIERAPKHHKASANPLDIGRNSGDHCCMRLPNLDNDGKTNRRRCKGPNCDKWTSIYCMQCGVGLCIDQKLGIDQRTQTTCFIEYHQRGK